MQKVFGKDQSLLKPCDTCYVIKNKKDVLKMRFDEIYDYHRSFIQEKKSLVEYVATEYSDG